MKIFHVKKKKIVLGLLMDCDDFMDLNLHVCTLTEALTFMMKNALGISVVAV